MRTTFYIVVIIFSVMVWIAAEVCLRFFRKRTASIHGDLSVVVDDLLSTSTPEEVEIRNPGTIIRLCHYLESLEPNQIDQVLSVLPESKRAELMRFCEQHRVE